MGGERYFKEPFHSAENRFLFFLFASLLVGCPWWPRQRNRELRAVVTEEDCVHGQDFGQQAEILAKSSEAVVS